MASLTVTPNPAAPSTVVSVAGAGFANYKTRLLLDGQGSTTNIFRPKKDGTFAVGITVSSTAKTQTLVAQQNTSSNKWVQVASVSIIVKVAPVNTTPSAPLNLTGIAGDKSINLIWQVPASNGGAAITGYNLYRNNVFIITIISTVYMDTGLTNGTLYTYTISAVNSVGEGAKSASTPALIPFAPAPPPAPILVGVAGDQKVTLSWG